MSRSDLSTAILAMVLALFLWVYVRAVRDTPQTYRLIPNVPVTVDGHLASGLAVQLDERDRQFGVRIKGPQDIVNNILPDQVKLAVDVSAITDPDITTRLPIKAVLPDGAVLAQRLPMVSIKSVELRQDSRPVNIALIATPPPGTTVGQYDVEPDQVIVEGTEKDMAQVKYVTVSLDPNEPLHGERTLVPYAVNDDGRRLDNVRVLTSAVTVRMASLTGQQTTRRVAVREPRLLNPASHYVVHVQKFTPDEVTLSGEAALLARQPAYIDTEPIDVHAMRQSTTRVVRLKVPKGLSVVEESTVAVSLDVHRQE